MSPPRSDALVFFGATGDLAYKQIFPTLQSMIRHGHLDVPIIGVAKAGITLEQLRERARQSLTENGGLDEAAFAKLLTRLDYLDGDYRDAATFEQLRRKLGDAQHPLHYLAIPPVLFGEVVQHLGKSGCAKGARVVVEKPFGRDLSSAQALNATLHEVFDEADLFRIDHYLGKEAVQNLVVFRFANRIFEPIWNREHISCVQITMAERFGVKGRGSLYDELGAVRDVVQNHLMQLLAILTMEPPESTHHASLRDEIATVLKHVRPIAPPSAIVRGQFRGYRDEPGVKPDSNVETFAALHLEIATARWEGVPFFIRTGKSLPVTVTEVMIDFREAPLNDYATGTCNHLRLRVGPEVVIALTTEVKKPGEGLIGEPIELTFLHHAGKDEMTAVRAPPR